MHLVFNSYSLGEEKKLKSHGRLLGGGGAQAGSRSMSEFCIGGSPFRVEGVSEVSKYTGGILGHT